MSWAYRCDVCGKFHENQEPGNIGYRASGKAGVSNIDVCNTCVEKLEFQVYEEPGKAIAAVIRAAVREKNRQKQEDEAAIR